MINAQAEFERWLDEVKKQRDKVTLDELYAISRNNSEIEERFYKELEFGTAGLRGLMGVGTNRMNCYVVRRVTAGLAAYINQFRGANNRGVAIAYDSRNGSKEFAMEAAGTLASYGIISYLYSPLHSVPQLSFAIRQLNCIAGIVITASHNPAEYNGYKVYWSNGAQVGPEQADSILECIRKLDYFNVQSMPFREARRENLIKIINMRLDQIYYNNLLTLMQRPALVHEHGGDVTMIYTPLHGSGYDPVMEVLRRMGLSELYTVEEQVQPDGNFPTVKSPNPEDPSAYKLAEQLANKLDASLILATDPDADRLGVAVRLPDGKFRVLTGNQIGCILINYLLGAKKELGTLPEDGLVVKSLVSTKLADAICNKYGVEIRQVLTGFRFIGEQMDIADARQQEFIFGFEESYGFLAGSFVRDKDAICAAMLVAEAAVYYSTLGKSLYDVLNDIYAEYGCYAESTKSYALSGKAGMEKIAEAMKSLRANPPMSFGETKVLVYEDFEKGSARDIESGEEKQIELPTANMLRFTLPNDAWVVVRPSGTEPKLKVYAGVKADNTQDANAALELLMKNVTEIIDGLLN